MFTQVHGGAHHPPGGLGIGLALVRRLIEMHGGTVKGHSDGVGLGSEFVISLPRMTAEPVRTDGARPAGMGEELPAVAPRRILVADDNLDALESLATVLKLCGHEVFSAPNGALALESAAQHLPQVALLDIGMPLLDGYEVARRIRAQEWGKGVTLVALTGWGQDADRRRSQEAGFDSHLVKPLDLHQLTQLLSRLPAA
jgi:CheY-like chemotaxis protein